jgi:predicted DNA-binding transcriptional regulator YafY
MRADRLVAALLLLQARGRVTAAELAEELEVSVATARRDLEALSGAGIPVYPQAGRGGGWPLLGGARTDLSGLTAGEAKALFVLLGPSAGVVPEARSALRKLVRALPGPDRRRAGRPLWRLNGHALMRRLGENACDVWSLPGEHGPRSPARTGVARGGCRDPGGS